MKRHLLYTTAILATLNGLQAFNPFTAIGNAASKVSCTTNLIKEVASGLPAYKQSQIQQIKKCVGNVSQEDHEALAENMAKTNPNFTKALSKLCKSNEQFNRNLKPECNVTMQAVSLMQGGSASSPGNQAGTHQQSPRKNAKHRKQMRHPDSQGNNNPQGYGNGQGCHCDCPEHQMHGNGYGVPPSPSNYGTPSQQYNPQGYNQPFPQMDPSQQGYYPQQQPMPQQMQAPQQMPTTQQWPQQQLPQQPQCAYPQQPQYGYPQ